MSSLFYKPHPFGRIPPCCLLLILFVHCNPSHGAKCEEPWKGWRGHCYYFSPIRQNFEEAEKTCYGFDSFLASIRSVEEFRFIAKMIQKLEAAASTQGWFIGIKQINVTGSDTYRWVDGSVSGFRLWLVNQPNNVYEQCVMMDGTAGYRWRDELCRERAYFICRKDVGAMQCYEGNVDGAREYDVSAAQCLEQCRGQGYKVAALSVVRCACFQSMDTKYFKKRPRHKCNARCAGQHCGPKGFFAVYSIEYYPELAKTCDDLRDVGVSKPGVYILQKDQAAAKEKRKKNEGVLGTRCFLDNPVTNSKPTKVSSAPVPKGHPLRPVPSPSTNKMAANSSTTAAVPIPFWKKRLKQNREKKENKASEADPNSNNHDKNKPGDPNAEASLSTESLAIRAYTHRPCLLLPSTILVLLKTQCLLLQW